MIEFSNNFNSEKILDEEDSTYKNVNIMFEITTNTAAQGGILELAKLYGVESIEK